MEDYSNNACYSFLPPPPPGDEYVRDVVRGMALAATDENAAEIMRKQAVLVAACRAATRSGAGAGGGDAVLVFLDQLTDSDLWFRDYHEFIRHSAGMSEGDVLAAARRLRSAGRSGAARLAQTDHALAPLGLVTREEWRRMYREMTLRARGAVEARLWTNAREAIRREVSEICASL